MSYGLKYTIPFKSISGKDCVIRLEEKDFAGEPMELQAGGNPILIDTDAGDLITPIRSSGATIQVFGSDYLQDLYTSDPQGVRVTLIVDGSVSWLGYLTPDTFSQDFSSPEFVYEVECVSALSTLKLIDFDIENDFVSFLQIIKRARDLSGYDKLYLTNSVRINLASFYDLNIASGNFFDELGEAMTYYEVLEEIARYAGCCFTPYQDDLYLLDYKAISMGFNLYEKYDGDVKTLVTVSAGDTVEKYRGTGAKLSRIPGKNKATVNCSLYEVDNFVVPFDDEGSEFTIMDPTDYKKNNIDYKEIRRYFNQPNFDMYKYVYNLSTQTLAMEVVHDKFDTYPYGIGSMFIRSAVYEINNKPSKLNFVDELLVKRNGLKTMPLNSLDHTKPILTLRSKQKTMFHKDVYFCISLDVIILSNEWPMTDGGIIVKADADTTLYVWAKFKVGNRSFNGTGWVEGDSQFRMPITIKKDSQMNGVYLSLDNTNTFDTGLGDLSGYVFKAADEIVAGECEFTLYDFEDSEQIDPGRTLELAGYTRFKEISVSYGIPSVQSIYGDWVGRNEKTDIIYEYEIPGSYTEPLDDIDLRICTNPEGKLALSSVIVGNDAFLQEIETDAFGTGQPENLLLNRALDLYSTPRFVIDPTLKNDAKPYTMFTEPHLNKTFAIAGGDEDVKMESCTYNLIEI